MEQSTETNLHFRLATQKDLPFLEEMLYEAIYWRPEQKCSSMEELFKIPEINNIFAEWGKSGDTAIIVTVDNNPIGAAWYRFWTQQNLSFGFVDKNTPELGIALKKEFRNKGIGTYLLNELLKYAKNQNIKHISLSVEPENYSRKLYQKLGFQRVAVNASSWTMVLDLKAPDLFFPNLT
jgi:[ribosomal protein S18]-alanine N-acetyltransferase